ncbi:MAG: hypothetical protein QM730_14075 [Anaerolineales bacterium]
MNELLFSQTAQIYLQGKDALQPLEITPDNAWRYFLGSESTNLTVRDHRQAAVMAASQAVQGYKLEQFTQLFSQPAFVEIREHSGAIEIDLFEPNELEGNATLWLGVIHDHLLPIHYMPWHIFVPIEDDKVAFAAIVED